MGLSKIYRCVKTMQRERNLLTEAGKNRPEIQKDKNFKTREQNATNRKCAFCDKTVHKAKLVCKSEESNQT